MDEFEASLVSWQVLRRFFVRLWSLSVLSLGYEALMAEPQPRRAPISFLTLPCLCLSQLARESNIVRAHNVFPCHSPHHHWSGLCNHVADPISNGQGYGPLAGKASRRGLEYRRVRSPQSYQSSQRSGAVANQ